MKGTWHTSRKRKKAWITMLIVMATAAMLVTGCSSSNSNSANSALSESDQKGSIGNAAAPVMEEGMTSSEANNADASGNTAEAEAGGGGGSVMPSIVASGEAMQGKIIYTASLTMEVEELKTASTTLRDAIYQSGGYILQFNDSRYEGEVGASYTIKVPAAGFMSFIDRLAKIPNKKFEQNLSGKDVSEEYVDLESRLKAAELVEERLLSMMDKATKADDLLQFSNQLAAVQEKMEEIKGRMRYLDNNVAYSTVNLRIYQSDQSLISSTDEKEESFGNRLSDVLEGSLDATVKTIQVLLLIIVGALPVLAVAAIIAVPIIMIVRARNRTRGGSPSPRKRLESAQWGTVVKDPAEKRERAVEEELVQEDDQTIGGRNERDDTLPQSKD